MATATIGIWGRRFGLVSLLALSQVIGCSGNGVRAQSVIIPDGTLGNEASRVTPNFNGLPIELIDHGAIRGSVLFHSFQEFNIATGRGAYFTNPAGITNIFSRVTGTNPSMILGTLGVLGNANLYFLNPNGIIFGPNASLDVRGSFIASGKGAAGNIEVAANSISLKNQGLISSDTTGGQGNINLRSQDLVLLHGSDIRTNATGNQVSGGDITLNTGFLIALQNSDITANSQDFRGGNVNVTAQGIFGTAFRPHLTPQSDITATGANSSLNGTVVITTPNVDPSHGVVTLPAQIFDASQQIAQGCPARSNGQENSFTVTGNSGLPPRPSDPAISDYPTGEVRSIPSSNGETDEPKSNHDQQQSRKIAPSAQVIPMALVPGTGWVFNGKGEVTLIAQAPNTNLSNLGSHHVSYSGR